MRKTYGKKTSTANAQPSDSRNCMLAYLACELLLFLLFHFLQKQVNSHAIRYQESIDTFFHIQTLVKAAKK
jgi:hypothetical protein